MTLLLTIIMALNIAYARVITLSKENTIGINQPISEEFVAKKQLEIFEKHNKLPLTQPLYLVMDTPGGSVISGNLLINNIKALGRPVHTITLFAASMGYQIVQELGSRYIVESGQLMSHRGAVSGMSGQIPGELTSRVRHIQTMLHEMNVKAAGRIGVDVKLYKKQIQDELWLTATKAKETNNVDEIVEAKCDATLEGTEVQNFQTMFGPVDVTFAKCPLISGPVNVDFSKSFNKEYAKRQLKVFLNKPRMEF